MKKTNKTLLKYLIEFIIVAFGVFLGVFVSDWNAQRKTDENTEKSITFIIDEMGSNIDKIQNSIEYQTKIITSVDSIVRTLDDSDKEIMYFSNKKFRFNDLPNWSGLGFSSLENISYKSAHINGVIGELNINTTRLIARAYQNQELYTEFSKQLGNKLLEINSNTKIVDVLVIFERLKYDILSTEKWLLNELNVSKEELEKIKYNNDYSVQTG